MRRARARKRTLSNSAVKRPNSRTNVQLYHLDSQHGDFGEEYTESEVLLEWLRRIREGIATPVCAVRHAEASS